MKELSSLEKVCDILVKRDVLNTSEAGRLAHAFREDSQVSFDEFLLDEGLVTKQDLLDALSVYFELPSFDCVGYFFDHELLHQFPKDFLLRMNAIPAFLEGDVLTVVARDPFLPELVSGLGRYVSYDIVLMVGLARDIQDAIKEFYDLSLTYYSPEGESVDERLNDLEQKKQAPETDSSFYSEREDI